MVGSHGRGALVSMLLGSVSRGALRHARCPVAVVRA
ncbi:universal stress protein [Nonomuraea maritima]